MDENNNFEKFPGSNKREASSEQMARANNWENTMKEGVPEFRGDKFGVANPENDYYGEAKDDEAENTNNSMGGAETVRDAMGEEYDEGIADAAELINYGLNEAARILGVEAVVQKIKDFDASGREDPIKDLFEYLGIDSPEERKELQAEGAAAMASEDAFRGGVNAPSQHKSTEGAFQALDDMKELIAEVEGADPRYDELRSGARAAGKGYFEYAVDGFGVQGLPELFQVLASQREQADALENGANSGVGGLNNVSEMGGLNDVGAMGSLNSMNASGGLSGVNGMGNLNGAKTDSELKGPDDVGTGNDSMRGFDGVGFEGAGQQGLMGMNVGEGSLRDAGENSMMEVGGADAMEQGLADGGMKREIIQESINAKGAKEMEGSLNKMGEYMEASESQYNQINTEGLADTNVAQQSTEGLADMGAIQQDVVAAEGSVGMNPSEPQQSIAEIAERARENANTLNVAEEQAKADENALGAGDVEKMEEELKRVMGGI